MMPAGIIRHLLRAAVLIWACITAGIPFVYGKLVQKVVITILLAGSALFTGCASTRINDGNRAYVDRGDMRTAPATALAFDPPVTAYAPQLNLDRSQRAPAAFVGYESSITYGVTRFDDRQYYDMIGQGYGRGYGGYTDRQAYSETASVRQR